MVFPSEGAVRELRARDGRDGRLVETVAQRVEPLFGDERLSPLHLANRNAQHGPRLVPIGDPRGPLLSHVVTNVLLGVAAVRIRSFRAIEHTRTH